jgi:hypothetical protein
MYLKTLEMSPYSCINDSMVATQVNINDYNICLKRENKLTAIYMNSLWILFN